MKGTLDAEARLEVLPLSTAYGLRLPVMAWSLSLLWSFESGFCCELRCWDIMRWLFSRDRFEAVNCWECTGASPTFTTYSLTNIFPWLVESDENCLFRDMSFIWFLFILSRFN